MEQQEQEEQDSLDQAAMAEYEAAQQEAYYWHVIQEFYGMLKVFGHTKVLSDLQSFKESVEPKKEEPRIQLL